MAPCNTNKDISTCRQQDGRCDFPERALTYSSHERREILFDELIRDDGSANRHHEQDHGHRLVKHMKRTISMRLRGRRITMAPHKLSSNNTSHKSNSNSNSNQDPTLASPPPCSNPIPPTSSPKCAYRTTQMAFSHLAIPPTPSSVTAAWSSSDRWSS